MVSLSKAIHREHHSFISAFDVPLVENQEVEMISTLQFIRVGSETSKIRDGFSFQLVFDNVPKCFHIRVAFGDNVIEEKALPGSKGPLLTLRPLRTNTGSTLPPHVAQASQRPLARPGFTIYSLHHTRLGPTHSSVDFAPIDGVPVHLTMGNRVNSHCYCLPLCFLVSDCQTLS